MANQIKSKIKYVFNHPFAMDGGGAKIFIQSVVGQFQKDNYEISHLDMTNPVIDFDILLVFTFTFWDIEVLKWYKSKGVKIVVFPIFDRTKSLLSYRLIKPFWKTIIGKSSIHVIRKQVLEIANFVVCANNTEKKELQEIYSLDTTKTHVLYQGLSTKIIELDKAITKDLFGEKYSFTDFIFCPAMSINNRKNQINLLRAVQGTDIKLVLNNTHRIEDNLNKEFLDLTMGNKNILCLEEMNLEMLVSTYKSAKICVSVSNSETAGYTNLEAGFLGCKLVVSDIPAFREYLGDIPVFVDQKNPKSILNGIVQIEPNPYDENTKNIIQSKYNWRNYCEKLIQFLEI